MLAFLRWNNQHLKMTLIYVWKVVRFFGWLVVFWFCCCCCFAMQSHDQNKALFVILDTSFPLWQYCILCNFWVKHRFDIKKKKKNSTYLTQMLSLCTARLISYHVSSQTLSLVNLSWAQAQIGMHFAKHSLFSVYLFPLHVHYHIT